MTLAITIATPDDLPALARLGKFVHDLHVALNVWSQNAAARKAFAAWGFRTCSERMALEL